MITLSRGIHVCILIIDSGCGGTFCMASLRGVCVWVWVGVGVGVSVKKGDTTRKSTGLQSTE